MYYPEDFGQDPNVAARIKRKDKTSFQRMDDLRREGDRLRAQYGDLIARQETKIREAQNRFRSVSEQENSRYNQTESEARVLYDSGLAVAEAAHNEARAGIDAKFRPIADRL